MKQKLWITLVTYLAYCIDKELYKAIDYLCEQVRVLVEHQGKQNKWILLTKHMKQMARILTDYRGFLKGKRYLIHDRDPLYNTKGFHDILKTSGIEPVRLPAQRLYLNAYSKRFVKSVKYECLNHLILSSVQQFEYVLKQYCQYYHHESVKGYIMSPINCGVFQLLKEVTFVRLMGWWD